MTNFTIHDIAKRAHVSSAAVSYVINNRPGVSRETREHIQKIIKETGYQPNLSSRKLVLNKSFNIHVVMGSAFASFDNLFYNSAIKRMIEVCTPNEYNLVLSGAENFERSALKRSILQKDVDGVIFLQDIIPGAVRELQAHKLPYVVLDAHELTAAHNSVYCDYGEAAYTATSYLLSKGHTKIGFVGMWQIKEFYESSCKGYKRALQKADIAPPDTWLCGGNDDEESVWEYAKLMSEKKRGLTAVLCATDVIAVTLIKQLMKLGVSVPEDISVCGMDDVVIARYCTPALTTVEIDKQKMGEEAIRLLLEMINNDTESKTEHICVHSDKIVERDSVKNII